MQVTEAVRDATVSGRKVKKGQTIVLDPDDGLLAVDNDPQKAVLAALGRLEPGFGLLTIYYGETATLDEAEALARKMREASPGRRRRGDRTAASRTTGTWSPPSERRRRSPAMSEVQGRRAAPARGSRALKPKAAAPAPRPSPSSCASPVGLSGIQQVAAPAAGRPPARHRDRPGPAVPPPAPLRRPARAAARSPTSATSTTATVASAQVRVIDISVQQTLRRRVQVTTARLTDGTGFAVATWFGRRYIERRIKAGDELLISGKVKHFATATWRSRDPSSSRPTPPTCSTSAGSCRSTGSPAA